MDEIWQINNIFQTRSISWLKITSTMVKIEDLTKKSNSAKKNFDDEEKVLKLC